MNWVENLHCMIQQGVTIIPVHYGKFQISHEYRKNKKS